MIGGHPMRKTVVITGGSSGIGSELVKVFAAGDYTVYNLSRRPGEHGGLDNVIHIPTDITDTGQVELAFRRIEEETGRADILINNAGFGISGAVEFTEPDDARRLFDVNFFGVFECIRHAVKLMRRNNGGRIINVSSAAAVFPIPFQAFYSASKAAVNSLTLALSNELKDFGISVCAVMPGDVRTGFTGARQKSTCGDDIYGGRIEAAVSVMEEDEKNGLLPEMIASDILRIASRSRIKPLYTLGLKYKLFAVLQKILPCGFVNSVIRSLYIKQ